MRAKTKAAALLAALAMILAGCGGTDTVACNDLDEIGDAIGTVNVEREAVHEEIIGDVAEEKAVYNCAGYDAWWQGEDD